MTKLLTGRTAYKTKEGKFEYPWAYDLYKKSEKMHWLPEEVDFREDISDWNFKLSESEKFLLTNLFRFFTQGDIDVASGYREIYLPFLGKHPEIAMMMMSFAAREAVHIDAYSKLIETVGMPESTYTEFIEIGAMMEKHSFVSGYNQIDESNFKESLLKALAIYSGFTEGMQLFSSFAILMNFERHGKMKGMANIVRWSIKDESLHVEGMTRLFRELYSESVEARLLGTYIREIAETMVELEDKFINLCFSHGDIQGLTPEEVKGYIRYIANKRWNQLGFQGVIFKDNMRNPLKWLEWSINGVEDTNFFEAKPTGYSKAAVTRNDEEIIW